MLTHSITFSTKENAERWLLEHPEKHAALQGFDGFVWVVVPLRWIKK